LAAIFADVDRQLAHLPTEDAPTVTIASTNNDNNISRMDAHVRAILAGVEYRLSALNTALGHRIANNAPSTTPSHRLLYHGAHLGDLRLLL
jgi:hypothetical protein